MKLAKVLLMLALFVTPSFSQETTSVAVKPEVVNHLLKSCVTIICPTVKGDGPSGHSEGSGFIVERESVGKKFYFVWTAAHVVESIRVQENILDTNSGVYRTKVKFQDGIKVVQPIWQDGSQVGKFEYKASVLCCDRVEDLALLRIQSNSCLFSNVTFSDKFEAVPLTGQVVHVGSILGELYTNSVSVGLVAAHGRVIENKLFDQATFAGTHGSSGGGVFDLEGKCVGIVLMSAGTNINFYCPLRRLKEWSEAQEVQWAIDSKVAMPEESQLSKIAIERNAKRK